MSEYKGFSKEPSSTLCWCCARATGGCSWSEHLTPVEGWTAKPVVKNTMTSYIVYDCPLFDRDSTYYGLRRLPREEDNNYNSNYSDYCY